MLSAQTIDRSSTGRPRLIPLFLNRYRRISVRRSVTFALLLLVIIAALQLSVNVHANSSAAFMLRRAETSYRQLSGYQQLSIDVLEYLSSPSSADRAIDHAHRHEIVEVDLHAIDALTEFEVELVSDNDGQEPNVSERERLDHISATIETIVAADAGNEARSEPGATYEQILRPMLNAAIENERSEIALVEQAMKELRGQMRVFGSIGIGVQIVVVGIVLLLINRAILDPISRLVSDIREIGRDRLAHRVLVPRHDEFGLLAQHINRMARHLDRGRRTLLDINNRLETLVEERTGSLRAKNEELRAIDESRRRFFADVSHELRTPLTAIVGEADVTLRFADNETKTYRDSLTSILANSTFLNRRIDDLMALARSLDGRLEIQSEIVDLNLVGVDALAEIRSLARVNCVIVQFEPLVYPVLIAGDRLRLRQSLMILLDNAVKFSPAYRTVEIRLVDHGTHAALTVSDQGKGIAVEDLPRVFDRFYQAGGARRMGGTGLGLSIARRIVDAHNGTIVATSGPPGGTTITMTFEQTRDVDI